MISKFYNVFSTLSYVTSWMASFYFDILNIICWLSKVKNVLVKLPPHLCQHHENLAYTSCAIIARTAFILKTPLRMFSSSRWLAGLAVGSFHGQARREGRSAEIWHASSSAATYRRRVATETNQNSCPPPEPSIRGLRAKPINHQTAVNLPKRFFCTCYRWRHGWM